MNCRAWRDCSAFFGNSSREDLSVLLLQNLGIAVKSCPDLPILPIFPYFPLPITVGAAKAGAGIENIWVEVSQFQWDESRSHLHGLQHLDPSTGSSELENPAWIFPLCLLQLPGMVWLLQAQDKTGIGKEKQAPESCTFSFLHFSHSSHPCSTSRCRDLDEPGIADLGKGI